MKNHSIIFGLILLALCVNNVWAKETIMDKKLFSGMTITQFKKACPTLKPVDNSQIIYKETIRGLDGKWSFDFKDGKLSWFLYNFYVQEDKDVNEKNFNKCLKATEQIIADLTKLYGKPSEVEEGTKTFRDPYKDHHWGYDVTEALWKTKKGDIKAKFKFFGGKGEYFFVVSVEYMRGK